MELWTRIVIIVICLLVMPATGSTVSEHDNYITFSSEDNVTQEVSSVKFYFTGNYSITANQPWDGVKGNDISSKYLDNNPTYQVDVMAGRQSSADPCNYYLQNSSIVEYPCTQANFALSGVLEIEGNDYPVVLVQVYDGLGHNDWFIGGGEPGFYSPVDDGGRPTLITPDNKYFIKKTDVAEMSVGKYQ